jgi:hypothetical protein
MPIKMPGKRRPASSPEDFIAGATAAQPARKPHAVEQELPWLDPRVRDDLRVQLNVKLPERLVIQRDWLAARLGTKKQDILEIALRTWVQEELRKLGLAES